jgi:hypothetical protein
MVYLKSHEKTVNEYIKASTKQNKGEAENRNKNDATHLLLYTGIHIIVYVNAG